MKIRNGFVSNSSSSSFCIIGIYNVECSWNRDSCCLKEYDESVYNEFNNLLRTEGEYNYYNFDDSDISLYGNGEATYVGIDCQELIESGKSFDEIRDIFINKMKEFHNIDIPKECVHMYYGETGE